MLRVIAVEVGFCYGHRLLNYSGKCGHLHGHQGTVQVSLGGNCVDELGMVMDYGIVKGFVKGWVDEYWDHRMLLNDKDPLVHIIRPHDDRIHPVPFNPTSECMGAQLLEAVVGWLTLLPKAQNPSGCRLLSVKFWETPTSSVVCYADGAVAAEGMLCGGG